MHFQLPVRERTGRAWSGLRASFKVPSSGTPIARDGSYVRVIPAATTRTYATRIMHSASAPARLSLELQRLPEGVFEPNFVADAPLVRFVAYTDQGRMFGWVRLRADRLTDLLNAREELLLAEAEVESLVDGVTRAADRQLVRRHDLVAVHASGPRGDEARRRRTRTYAVAVQSGSFLIGGLLHAPPDVDPVTTFFARPPMVPLTDAWIEFWSAGERRIDLWSGTLIVNRDQADAVWTVTEQDLAEGLLRPSVLRDRAPVA